MPPVVSPNQCDFQTYFYSTNYQIVVLRVCAHMHVHIHAYIQTHLDPCLPMTNLTALTQTQFDPIYKKAVSYITYNLLDYPLTKSKYITFVLYILNFVSSDLLRKKDITDT